MPALIDFARKYLIYDGVKCGRHCERSVRFVELPIKHSGDDEIAGAYVDPGDYVSRVVYFSLSPDHQWFRGFLREQLGERLKDKDLRFATRHGWELGREAEAEAQALLAKGNAKGITEYYWTFYPRSEEEKKRGTYFCSKEKGGCGKRLFVSDDPNSLCESCGRK